MGVAYRAPALAAVISLIVILFLSVMVTRIGSVALLHTGLSRDAARFQALSAFTGVGFTTVESESVTNHPVRRRIVGLLMMIGNAGFVTVLSSVVLTLLAIERSATSQVALKLGLLSGGLFGIWALARSEWVDRRLSLVISRALRRFTNIDVRDYASLLQVGGDYRVTEMRVEADD